MTSSNTLYKHVSVMPDLANLFRIDHLWLDFTLLIKFEIPTIFLRRIVFADYNYNVIYLLPPSFQSSNIFVEKKEKEILLG